MPEYVTDLLDLAALVLAVLGVGVCVAVLVGGRLGVGVGLLSAAVALAAGSVALEALHRKGGDPS